MNHTAKIDNQELQAYISESYGDLDRIPIVCEGTQSASHRKHYMDAEPDSCSVYCIKCGNIVNFTPLTKLI